MVGFFAAIQAPDSQGMVTTVLSYLPFTSPMVMPVRYGVDQASLSAAGVAGIINVIFLLVFCWLSANAYERNVLVYNNKGIFKALRHSLQMQRNRH
jgi:ABC-2 type transport system permease protein